ncbi:MAG: hydroxymethylbilane synthase, partial [Candidatus Caldatribacteriaceae bacterium]
MKGSIRIGSRGSKLAILQARIIGEKLRELYPDWNYQIIPIQTRGDVISSRGIGEIEERGIFVKEVEEALLRRDVDLAVHSLKDLPTETPPGLVIAAVLERDDPREAFLSRSGQTLAGLPPGSRVGTSSLRRMIQLKEIRPDIEVVPLRGNVPTRIQKMNEGEVEALVVALAGLKRLGMENLAIECFSPEIFVPAAGQGT